MSGEKLSFKAGQEVQPLDPASAEKQLEAIRQRLETEAQSAPNSAELADTAREEINLYAKPSESYQPHPEGVVDDTSRQTTDTSVYSATLQTVRQQLPSRDRRLSRVIHHPVIETLSEVTEKTIARPSLLLGGFIGSGVGSLVLYLMARHNGYAIEAHYALYLLFVGGAALGLTGELLLRLKRRFFS